MEKPAPAREQGVRPGLSSSTFGKNDEENRLINNLFGDEEPDKKKDRKKKESKKEKQPKEKAPKEKGAGLFGFLKGKKKDEEPEEDLLAGFKKAEAPGEAQSAPKWEPAPERREMTVEAYRPYIQEEDGEDSTAIAGDGETRTTAYSSETGRLRRMHMPEICGDRSEKRPCDHRKNGQKR